MAFEKRKRSANWMVSEKGLVDLVTEHFNVVENKKTDGVSMKQKLAGWVTICEKYNSQTLLTHRSAENLKAQWENLKKAAKKEAASNRQHLIQRGGGPSRPKANDPTLERIISLITPSAVGLHNPYDNDNIETVDSHTRIYRQVTT
ncbi:myb/SANT-like DNA-binding domain-containing protein 3 [Vanessa cardui]|uniref:myb/SANT-like DNA-binding domain-containing protein 3 n=1 Tax=Vanessa cardui TaxID=171605 RepID=UPI001F146874|nr:myb/SANT-like DNA-binding domain-containing protein 3 [Vanessa cardui]